MSELPAAPSVSASRRAPFAAAALVLCAALAAFGFSLRNGYTFDDILGLRDNPYFQHGEVLPNLFSRDYFRVSGEVTYRPIVTASYVLDHALWTRALPPEPEQMTAEQFRQFTEENYRRWAIGLHATNLLLHAANALLVFLLTLRLWNAPAALVAGLLFAVHPVQAEAVNAAAFREDLLAAFWVLAGSVIFLTWTSRARARAPAATACYVLGLLSKESAAMMPAALFAVERILFGRERPVRRAVTAYAGFAVVACLYVLVRFGPMYSPVETETPYPGGSLATGLLTAVPTLVRDLRLIVAPVGLCVDYDVAPSRSLLDWRVLGAAAALIAILWAVVRWRGRWPALAAGTAWYFIMLLPVCNILPIPNIMADRYLYLPVVGVFLAVGVLGAGAWERARPPGRRAGVILLAVVVGILIALSVARTRDWRDAGALSASTVAVNPRSAKGWLNLGNDHAEHGRLKKAEECYRRILQIDPRSGVGHAQLGQALEKQGRLAEAEAAYRRAIECDPRQAVALNALGLLAVQGGRPSDAVEFFRRAADAGRDPGALPNLATALAMAGRMEEAERCLLEARRLAPLSVQARGALGNLYYRTDRFPEALAEHRAALRLSPGDPGLLMNIGADFTGLGQWDEAAGWFRHALKADPSLAEAQYNLALCLANTGKMDEARACLADLLRRQPNMPDALYQMARILALTDRRFPEAMELLARVQARMPGEPQSAALLGWCMALTDRAPAGVRLLRDACDQLRDDVEAWTWLREAARRAGDAERVQAAEKRLKELGANPAAPRNPPAEG